MLKNAKKNKEIHLKRTPGKLRKRQTAHPRSKSLFLMEIKRASPAIEGRRLQLGAWAYASIFIHIYIYIYVYIYI